MKKKIFRSIMAVVFVVLTASLCLTSRYMYDYYNQSQITQLKEELSHTASGVERYGISYFEGFDSGVFRFTLVSADGTVVYDSKADVKDMENHMRRQEIREAMKNGSGSSARYSATLTERTLYEARKLTSGDVLRVSVTQMTVGALLVRMTPFLCVVILCTILLAILLSERMAKSIVRPLQELDLEHPAENVAYEELTPILRKLNKQHEQIRQQIQELKKKSDEFDLITSSMEEGLVLLDHTGHILHMNGAAMKLLETDGAAVGSEFLTAYRSVSMSHAMEDALQGKHSEFCEEKNGCWYQFLVNPTNFQEQLAGVVILCIDVTERTCAEQNRREFTANVSHELKTPLQSIIGSAELLENDLVKPEDVSRFVGNIKCEASRLVVLINDIIRLSQFDEEARLPLEDVDLYAVAQEAMEVLQPAAEKKDISFRLAGEHCILSGIHGYLYEIIYNLCDNGIRYNRQGGSLEIGIRENEEAIFVEVADTGIGIPLQHQSRIFERFYRVDKSHSRSTGGTGLGLSIVKHGAAYHGGTVHLESRPGEGTRIRITFPKDFFVEKNSEK